MEGSVRVSYEEAGRVSGLEFAKLEVGTNVGSWWTTGKAFIMQLLQNQAFSSRPNSVMLLIPIHCK